MELPFLGGNNYERGPLFFFAPDEICIMVSEPTPPPAREDKKAQIDRYNTLVSQLNDRLKGIVADSEPTPALLQIYEKRVETMMGNVKPPESVLPLVAALASDLAPDPKIWPKLQQIGTDGGMLLRSLLPVTPDDSIAKAQSYPWTVIPRLPDPDGKAIDSFTTVFFVGVGSDTFQISASSTVQAVTDDANMRMQTTRDLVNVINWNSEALGTSAHQAINAEPHWLSSALGRCPCPGSPPEWIPSPSKPGYWSFRFGNETIADVVSTQRKRKTRSNVVVAILDTCPRGTDVDNAATKHSGNLLLQSVSKGQRVAKSHTTLSTVSIDASDDKDLSVPEAAFNTSDRYGVNWRDQGKNYALNPTAPVLRMDDHGVFVNGIIRDIAPYADTHLIRVLGGYGGSNMRLIIQVLEKLTMLIPNADQRLVVNMSLGFAIPPGIELLRMWLPHTATELAGILTGAEDLTTALANIDGIATGLGTLLGNILTVLRGGLDEMLAYLSKHPQILVVAAAGNDNGWFNGSGRPEPRWPAAYDGVLSVAALDCDGEPAGYSNRGDVGKIDNSVATFGGNTTQDKIEDLGTIDVKAKPVDAVKGIYSNDDLTLGPGKGPNPSGWVYWAGTSFATPIISGIAADLWAQRLADGVNPYGSPELIAELVTLQRGTNTDLDSATIRAWQEWVPKGKKGDHIGRILSITP